MQAVFKNWLVQRAVIVAILSLTFIAQMKNAAAEEDLLRQNSKIEIECSSRRFCLEYVNKPGVFRILTKVTIVNRKGEILKQRQARSVRGPLEKKVINFLKTAV